MRIDAGSHRGTTLIAPQGADTRPTSDRARQAIFNILVHSYDAVRDAKVLDVFAGSGAMGLEALSRSAQSLVVMENNRAALSALKRNVTACHEDKRTLILDVDATRPPKAGAYRASAPCSLVFLDPPYGKGLVATSLAALREAGWFAPEALIVAEMATRDSFAPPGGLKVIDERTYGKARIVLMSGV